MPVPRRVAAAALTAGVLVLAGCTGGSDGPRPTTTPPPTSASPAPEPTQAPPDSPTAQPTTPAATPTAAPTTPPAGLTTVTPFITYAGPGTDAGTIEVAAFVPEVVEDGGTCTATITATGVKATAPGYADASSTSCGLLVLPVAPAGQTIVVSYSSATSAGTSEPVVAQ